MNTPQGEVPRAQDIARAASAEARLWLDSQEFRSRLATVKSDDAAVASIEGYFTNWKPLPMSLDEISRYFLVDYLQAGLGAGSALRLDPVSAIIRSHVGDSALHYNDHIKLAMSIRATQPNAYLYMLDLARKHSEICQEVLRSAFKAEELPLVRKVSDATKHFAVESWAYGEQVSSYGPITLHARVPLSSVLSVRPQENEIVVIRHPWESSIDDNEDDQPIKDNEPSTTIPSWRENLAEGLEGIASRIRGNLRS